MSEQFESQVKRLFETVEIEPGEAVWQRVREEIRPEKRRRRFAFWWLLPVALAGGGVLYFMQGDERSVTPIEAADKKTEKQNPGRSAHQITEETAKTELNRSVAATSATLEKTKGTSTVGSQRSIPGTSKRTPFFTSQSPSTKNNKANKSGSAKIPSVEITQDDISSHTTVNAIPPVVAIDAPVKSVQPDSSATVQTSLQLDSSMVTDVKTPIKVQKKSGWRFGMTMDIGLAGKSAPLLSMAKSAENVFSSGSGPTSGIGATIRQVNHVNKGLLLGLGVTAEKDLGKKFTFRSIIAYQYQSFDLVTERFKDSVATSSMISLPWYRSTDRNSLHMLNASAGLALKLYDGKKIQFGLGASFDNLFILSARAEQDVALENGNSSIANQSMNTTNTFRSWQPHLGLSLPVNFFTKQPGHFQVSPYLRQGLRPSGAQTSSGNKHLSSFGISTIYFFK